MLLQFQCYRKHFFLNTTYVLSYAGQLITIGKNIKNAKYKINVNLQSKITLHLEMNQSGFSIEYKGNQKIFFAEQDKIKELKKHLDGKICYCDMSLFYKQITELGNGAYSKVLVVQSIQTKQQFAAKYVNKEREGKHLNENLRDIYNEIQIVTKLNHPNIIKIKEVYDKGNAYAIIYEYIDGQTLEQFINEKQIPISQSDIQSIMRQILLALIYIHEQGILHRDMKPDNIMIEKTLLNIKIIDFGLSTYKSNALIHPKCGTPGYIAPEVIATKTFTGNYDCKCDIFSSGAIFYKLITQQDLFYGDILEKNINFDFNLDELQLYNLPDSCIDLINHMLELDSKKRYSAKESLQHPYFKETLRPSAKSTKLYSSQTNFQAHSHGEGLTNSAVYQKLNNSKQSIVNNGYLSQRQLNKSRTVSETSGINKLSQSKASSIQQQKIPVQQQQLQQHSQFFQQQLLLKKRAP